VESSIADRKKEERVDKWFVSWVKRGKTEFKGSNREGYRKKQTERGKIKKGS